MNENLDYPIDELYIQHFCDDLTLLDGIYVSRLLTTVHFIVFYCDDSRETVFKLV
jgi:hypothetical protein